MTSAVKQNMIFVCEYSKTEECDYRVEHTGHYVLSRPDCKYQETCSDFDGADLCHCPEAIMEKVTSEL